MNSIRVWFNVVNISGSLQEGLFTRQTILSENWALCKPCPFPGWKLLSGLCYLAHNKHLGSWSQFAGAQFLPELCDFSVKAWLDIGTSKDSLSLCTSHERPGPHSYLQTWGLTGASSSFYSWCIYSLFMEAINPSSFNLDVPNYLWCHKCLQHTALNPI